LPYIQAENILTFSNSSKKKKAIACGMEVSKPLPRPKKFREYKTYK
jgi:hypothetical protein